MHAKPLVLVADDDPDIRELVRLRLERSGYAVVSATDGAQALELAADCAPDLVLEGELLAEAPSLTELGLPAGMQMELERPVDRGVGALLVTGPTGSGKSTTLHGALADLARSDRTVITVEDPVEYELPGAYQPQVHAGSGAPGTLTRLARRLCLYCREHDEHEGATLFRARGCRWCGGGHFGRVGIFQLLTVHARLRELVADGAPHDTIAAAAAESGMATLRADGLAKVDAGLVSPEELHRVVPR